MGWFETIKRRVFGSTPTYEVQASVGARSPGR